MLHANSIAGELVYNNKFESSETLTTTGIVGVYCRSNDDCTRKVFRSWQNISSDGASQTAADRLFNVHFQSFIVL